MGASYGHGPGARDGRDGQLARTAVAGLRLESDARAARLSISNSKASVHRPGHGWPNGSGSRPMSRHFRCVVIALLAAVPRPATAADTGAVGDGDWSNVATWTNGVPGPMDNAYIGGGYPTGAALNATVNLSQNSSAGTVWLGFNPRTSGTLDLAGLTLSANNLYFGTGPESAAAVLRTGGGTLSINSTTYMYVGDLLFDPGDVTAGLSVFNSATATTVTTGNVTGGVYMNQGTLNLGADLNLANALFLNGTLNANGHAIRAGVIELGWQSGAPFTLNNRGPITARSLLVSSRFSPAQTTFNLNSSDAVTGLNLYGISSNLPPDVSLAALFLYSNSATPPAYATASTSSAGNVTEIARVDPGCTLTLGADVTLASELDLGGTLNANAHAVSAGTIYVGRFGGPATIQHDGPLHTNTWNQSGGTRIRLNQPGDVLGTLLLNGNCVLTIGDAAGQMSGLTISDPITSDLFIDNTSYVILEVNGLAGGWVMRWANPIGGNHIADLQNLINAGAINDGGMTFSYLNGGSYSLTTDSAYTYVSVVGIPEPSALAMSAVAAGLMVRLRRASSRAGRGPGNLRFLSFVSALRQMTTPSAFQLAPPSTRTSPPRRRSSPIATARWPTC
jgi:hypothetical protein